jgi:hypothetical protein
MKFLVNSYDHVAVNLANVSEITISCNWLKLTVTDSREVSLIYGTDYELDKLFERIKQFVADDAESVLDCFFFLKTL